MDIDIMPNYNRCYVCGDENHGGMQHRFVFQDGHVCTKIEHKPEYMGHGAIHGGVAATLLDEAMGLSSTLKKNRLCVTAEVTIRFLKPLDINQVYYVRGRLERDRNVLCETYGEIIDENDDVYVKATGKYVPTTDEESDKIHPNVFRKNH